MRSFTLLPLPSPSEVQYHVINVVEAAVCLVTSLKQVACQNPINSISYRRPFILTSSLLNSVITFRIKYLTKSQRINEELNICMREYQVEIWHFDEEISFTGDSATSDANRQGNCVRAAAVVIWRFHFVNREKNHAAFPKSS